VSNRLEGIEEAIDRLGDRLESLNRGAEPGLADRLAAVEGQLTRLVGEVGTGAAALDARPAPLPREQERLAVDAPPPRKRAAKKK
jgi:hypothetical protein